MLTFLYMSGISVSSQCEAQLCCRFSHMVSFLSNLSANLREMLVFPMVLSHSQCRSVFPLFIIKTR